VRVAIMGAPGAGKGTQAKLLAEQLGVEHISTGDILRQARDDGTKLGLEARDFMERGRLVPDDVMLGIIEERLRRPSLARGFVLDGFPRTVPQAEALQALGQPLSAVVLLTVPDEELVHRLSGRRVCRKCGAMFQLTLSPPRQPGRCDRCDGDLYQRDDDRETTIRHRMEVYARETAPVLEHYRRAGLLREVPGTGSREQVFARVRAGLQ
jgi:adenylate kinase